MANITPQARDIYQLLASGDPMTATDIAKDLGILPNAVYRSVRVLNKFGFIHRVGEYPTYYIVKPPLSAIDWYTQSIRNELLAFLPKNIPQALVDSNLNISFITNRNELLEKSNLDLTKVKKEVSLIVSGLEVPGETIFQYQKAIQRGVKIRILVQNRKESKKEMLQNWNRAGIQVKYYPLIEARILVFDRNVVYITAYNPEEKDGGVGVRFNYSPIAHIMQEYFEQRWLKATPL